MATSLTKTPSSVALSKNPGQVEFGIQSDQYITTPGTNAVLVLGYGVSDNPANGETLVLVSDRFLANITFTFTSGVPANHLEIAIGATSADTNNNLLDACLANYEILTNYAVTKPAGSVILTARETGADYDITVDVSSTSSITSAPTAGTDEVVKDDLRIIADLWILTAPSVYSLALSQSFTPDSTGSVSFDVGQVLLSYLEATLPAHYTDDAFDAAGPIVTYKLLHTDFYSDDYHAYNDSGALKAVLAGYPEKLLGTQQFVQDYFSGTAARKFLTRIPRGYLYMPAEAPLYLYYYVGATADYRLGVKLYYDDGTDETLYDLITENAGEEIIGWPAGYDLLDLDNEKTAGKTVLYYDVFVINAADLGSSTLSSELFRIHLDEDFYMQSRYLLFLNSLGGMDTAHFTGNLVEGMETEGDNYLSEVPTHDEETTYGERKMGIKTFTTPGTWFSGWRKKEYIRYLQELVKSELIYQVESDQYVEMRMDTTSLEVIDNNADQFGVELEITPAQINRGGVV